MQKRIISYVVIALIPSAFITTAIADSIEALLQSQFNYLVGRNGHFLVGAIVFVGICAMLFALMLYMDPRKPDRPRRRKGFDVLPPK